MTNWTSKKEGPLLEVLKQNMTEIWCMISIEEGQIIHCSGSFSDLWEVHGIDLEGFAISNEHTNSAPIRASGWLREFLPTLEEFVSLLTKGEAEFQLCLKNSPFVAEVHSVANADGCPSGRLAFLRTYSPGNRNKESRATGNSNAVNSVTPATISPGRSAALADSRTHSGTPQTSIGKSLQPGNTEHQKSVLSCLSPRELEIVHHLYDGVKNSAIATRLNISSKTVEKHRSHIMKKLGVQSIAGLIRILAEARLTQSATNAESN